MRPIDKLERAIKYVALAVAAFVVGGIFYSLIGFQAPGWFEDTVLYVVTLGD